MKAKEPIKLKAAEIIYLGGNIVEVITSANYETTIEDVAEINKTVKSLVGDNPHGVLVITQQGATASSEAREYAAKQSFRKNIIAEAIVIKNLAIRLGAIVYMKVSRPKQKIKLFNSRKGALNWLKKEMKKVSETSAILEKKEIKTGS